MVKIEVTVEEKEKILNGRLKTFGFRTSSSMNRPLSMVFTSPRFSIMTGGTL